jgi:hypothetical protein
MQADIHQHLWTEPLLDALRSRRTVPFVRDDHGLTVLYCAGEQPYAIDLEAEAPDRRARLVEDDQLDLAVLALSSPIGIEALAREDSTPLIEAHLEGLRGLSRAFASWGPVALDHPEPDDVDDRLGGGCVGISLPAGALAGYDALDVVGPALDRVATRGAPLLVHPGPGAGSRRRDSSLGDPLWWPALTDYVAQMQAAWLTFMALGRREHPQLTVVFAMLAGAAPLQSERLQARGGPAIDLRDRRVFYDTSSYGPVAIEAMGRQVGRRQLLYGSDRPVIEPVATGWDPALRANSGNLLTHTEVAA